MTFSLNKLLIYNYGFLNIGKDVNTLVLGDSHTETAINDLFLNNTINLSSSADSYFYTYVKLRAITGRNTNIEKVIIGLSYHNLSMEIEELWMKNELHINDRFSKYCYYFTIYDLNKLLKINPYAVFISSIEIPKYTIKLILKIFSGKANPYGLNIGKYKDHKRNILKKEVFKNQNSIRQKYILSDIEIDYLLEIVSHCKKNNIELIFINTPLHYSLYESINIEEKERFNQFYRENLSQLKFLDFSYMKFPDDCFNDLVHLNFKGSEIFTKHLFNIEK